MHILCPVNKLGEVEAVIEAGASELYCGVLPDSWKRNYTNMASANRREWQVSNLVGFDQLREVVSVAHAHGVPVCLTLNALYSEAQYPGIRLQVEAAVAAEVDAVIVADLGLMMTLPEWAPDLAFYVSTGGTTFNSEAAKFYTGLGARRVILPRHFRVDEMIALAERNPDIEFECFILNRGCKNIDGFCTFQHGVNEVRFKGIWTVPKKLNFDYHLLNAMRRLPEPIATTVAAANIYGSVGACFLNYDIKVEALSDATEEQKRAARETLSSSFNLLSGMDTCGGCDLLRLYRGGIHRVKIVGRSNLTRKKVRDVTFLRRLCDRLDDSSMTDERFRRLAKTEYRRVYGSDCREHCYYV